MLDYTNYVIGAYFLTFIILFFYIIFVLKNYFQFHKKLSDVSKKK